MKERKLNLKRDLVGKVLYINRRRYLEIDKVQRIPGQSWWIFLSGYMLSHNAKPYFVISQHDLNDIYCNDYWYHTYIDGKRVEIKEKRKKKEDQL